MKKLFTLIFAAALILAMSTTAFAVELPDGDILGYWKLDASLENDAGGADAEFIGYLFADALFELEDYTWIEGVDGGYAWKSETAIKDGIKFGAPTSQSMTMMLWVKAETSPMCTPILWWGEQVQSNALGLGGEAWIGLWNEWNENWNTTGICVGSNNAAGNRVAIYPSEIPFEANAFPWTHVALSVEYDEATGLSAGKLYYNGTLVGEGTDLPFVQSPDSYVYFGVNAWNWNIDGYIDEVIIYNEVLSADEIAGIYGQYATPSEEVVVAAPFAAPETEAPETEAPETEAPETEAPETEADTTAAPETEAPEEGGCGSSMGTIAIAVAMVATLGCAVIKKH